MAGGEPAVRWRSEPPPTINSLRKSARFGSLSPSALKNAATAQESYLVANDEYATTETELESEGFKKAADVTALTITLDATGSQKYCMVASHASLTDDTAVSSDSSEPTGPNSGGGLDGCTAGVKS